MNKKKMVAFLAAALLTSFVAWALAQERTEGERWNLSSRMLVVDNCDVICPCLFGNDPTHGHCRHVAVVEIEEGSCGDTNLAGTRWAMLGEFRGDARKGTTYGFSAFYIDSRASKEQKAALRKIFASEPFSKLGERLGVDEVEVDLSSSTDPLEPVRAKVGEKGSFTAEPVPGGDGKRPLAVENPTYSFPTERVVLAKAKGSFKDHGKELEVTEGSGELSRWRLEGRAAADSTLPAGHKKGE
jgi:hypothetical protein